MPSLIAMTAEQLGEIVGFLLAFAIGLLLPVAIIIYLVRRTRIRPPPLPTDARMPVPTSSFAPTMAAPSPRLTQEQQDERLARILKRVRRIELITRGLVKETLGGQYHSRFKGQGIEFDDFREYQPGDDVRFMDWNVTARMNSPFVRKYIEERELTVLLVVDVSGSGDYGSRDDSKRELSAELAAVFAFSAISNQDKVGLVLVSDQVEAFVPARKGLAHTLRIVRDILNHEPRSLRSDIEPGLRVALERIAHRSLIVLVSDFLLPDTKWEHSLRALVSKHDVAAVSISDHRELELPNAGRVCLQDAETGEQVIVNTSNPSVRRLYEQRILDHREDVADSLRRSGVEVIHATTGDNYVPSLKAYFRARRRKR